MSQLVSKGRKLFYLHVLRMW